MDSLQSLLSKRQDFSPVDPVSLTTTNPITKSDNHEIDQNANSLPSQNNSLDAAKITQILLNLRAQIDAALLLVTNQTKSINHQKNSIPPTTNYTPNNLNQKPSTITNGNTDNRNQLQIIEGVFNGEKMVGPDGHEYSIPTNYASKSKLVEGDLMKLTITPTGAFIYKQIGPIERRRLIGEAMLDEKSGQWSVTTNNKVYKILTASTTFFRAKPGMQAVILVPKDGESRWAAVENIFSPNQY